MTPEQFAYWLQGFLEIGQPEELGLSEIEIIKEHLAKTITYKPPVNFPVHFGSGGNPGGLYC